MAFAATELLPHLRSLFIGAKEFYNLHDAYLERLRYRKIEDKLEVRLYVDNFEQKRLLRQYFLSSLNREV